MVLIPPIVAGFTWILLNTGPWVPFALWYDPLVSWRMQTCKRSFSRHWNADGAASCRAFIFAVQIAAITIYPVLIAPLFNKFDPLPPGTLRCGPLVAYNRLVGMLAALLSHALSLLSVSCFSRPLQELFGACRFAAQTPCECYVFAKEVPRSRCGLTTCGSYREKIEELASSLRFPLKKLYVVDGSTRSAHSNVRPSSAHLPA